VEKRPCLSHFKSIAAVLGFGLRLVSTGRTAKLAVAVEAPTKDFAAHFALEWNRVVCKLAVVVVRHVKSPSRRERHEG
jgi:hypothetical protein